jgi:hypothetical protein
MPQPVPSDVHIDRWLSTVSTGYMQDASVYIADRVFPVVPCSKQSDKVMKFDKQPWMRRMAKPRALSSESAGGGYTVDSGNYFADVYAFHHDIDDRLRANADAPLSVDDAGTQFVINQLRLEREYAFFSSFFVTGIWTTEWSGVASDTPNAALYQFERWDRAGSTPIADVKGRCTNIQLLCGRRPNVAVLQRQVFDALQTNTDIVDRIKYTSRDSVSEQVLAALWGLEEVMVADAVYDSADVEGAAASMSFIAGKNAMLAYRTRTPALNLPSAGYIPVWTGYLGAGAYGNRIKKFRMEELESDRVEGELAYDMYVACADAGAMLLDCIS